MIPNELDAARVLVETVVAYFNKRGVAHAERKGNEDIAAMADQDGVWYITRH